MIQNLILFPVAIADCAFAYRVRGGGWVQLGNDTLCRLIWAVSLFLCYALASQPSPNWFYLASILPAAFLSMLVPHAFCQNMGRWPTPQRKWPAWFLPELTQSEWDSMPLWMRAAYDAFGMAGVAATRAIIVFPLIILFLYFTASGHNLAAVEPQILCVIRACAALTVLQPLAYLIGFQIPFTITPSLTARSTQWGEFLTGAAWALAFFLL